MIAVTLASPEPLAHAWPERNQQWLLKRHAFWRDRLLQRADAGSQPPATFPGDDAAGFRPAAFSLRDLFGLSTFETELLVLAAGIEIDTALRAAVTEVQSLPPRSPVRLNFSLALAILPEPHWDALSPEAALRYWSLAEFDTTAGLADCTIRIDERVLHFLTGVAAIDERLAGVARLDDAPIAAGHDQMASDIAAAVSGPREPLVMLANAASDASLRRQARSLARAALLRAGLQTIQVDGSMLGTDARDAVELARRLDRESALAGAGIVLVFDADGAQAASAVRCLAALHAPVITLGALTPLQLADLPRRHVRRITLAHGDAAASSALAPALRRAAGRALQQFRVDDAVLEQALGSVAATADGADVDTQVWDTLREAARGGLDSLAQRIDSRTTFDDLVVPPPVAAQLREIADQLGQRQRVYEEWGFGDRHPRGLGIAALFAGESGTGKTLAAEAIANATRLDLYRIDLAAIVSKYIGETEKNLSRVFDAAERSGAVLLFDEADALFGKRSEVKDSHDRYANIEIAYLLQRIESYRGLAVLTSNMKSALDRAFMRRIRFIVQFPFPEETAREQIWRLQFPPRAPLGDIDYRALARLQLSGGHIRSVALNAAFRAAGRGTPIQQDDVLTAARAEFAKLERTFTAPQGARV
jgi:hypothetical protein